MVEMGERREETTEAPAGGVPLQTPQAGVPRGRADRDRVLATVREYVAEHAFDPPLTFNELHEHSGAILRSMELGNEYRDWVTVVLNSETWRPAVAATPPDRRLLLLPQCLRDHANCPGEIDEWGLVCKGCGRCVIHSLKAEAEALGYVVLVSEGTAAVLALVKSGQVRAFVGSSCMSTLEKVFPVVSMVGVPAIAVPLLYDGCINTALDVDWLTDAMRLGIDEAESA
jgi:hypothetical protein